MAAIITSEGYDKRVEVLELLFAQVTMQGQTPLQSRAVMTIEQVREFYETQPFQPFVIHSADGREIPVPSREFILASPTGRTMVVYRANGVAHFIDLLLVTDIELKPTNGARRRRR